jgi:NADH-quinone oxidoreductase subunit J
MSSLLATNYAIPDLITFFGAALMIVAGAVGVVTMRNPVHAALSLVLTLFGVAVLFIELQADFLAAVQVIVYAGAIVVLFLFVIMFLGVDRQENIEDEPLEGQRPLAYLLVLVAAAGVLVLTASAHWVTGARHVAGNNKGVNVANIGRSVFTTYLFAFEATAALLVIAVVGAVVLARRPSAPLEDLPPTDAPAEPEAGAEAGAEGGYEAGADVGHPDETGEGADGVHHEQEQPEEVRS